MPRDHRLIRPGMICHLTHRCHNRSFLLRFARDRSEYRNRLREISKEFSISLLSYCLTSNHAHIIATENEEGGISRMMQRLEGGFAAYYNSRKQRSGSFWSDRFYCTIVEDGAHFANCMTYVDLNMVRAGIVPHPKHWPWCGYTELVGEKNRYRLLNTARVTDLLGIETISAFREIYRLRIDSAIEEGRIFRQGYWTESIAVGSESYVRKIGAAAKKYRREMEIGAGNDGVWFLRESASIYALRRQPSILPDPAQ